MTQADLRALAERVEAGADDDETRMVVAELQGDPMHIEILMRRENALDSLDAALALKERVLPGWWVRKIEECGEDWYADLLSDDVAHSSAFAPTPARALVAAILRARAEMMETVDA